MLKAGIFGVGHLGRIHAGILDELPEFLTIGFFDPDDEAAAYAERELGLIRFTDPDVLIGACDTIHIITPTIDHFGIAVKAIKKSRHVFIEKPVTQTLDEAKKLMHLAAEASVHVQVGHVERFNPAFIAAQPFIQRPMFIETQRLSPWTDRGTDVSVVLDLMIHDIDIILSIVPSNVRRVSATGVAVIGNSPDIAQARIEFDNGCVASLTASRIAQLPVRRTQIFQRNATIVMDLLEKAVEVALQKTLVLPSGIVASNADRQPEPLCVEKPSVLKNNAIAEELRSFARSIRTNGIPAVSIEDACRSMELAAQITERLKIARTSGSDNI